VTRQLVFDLAEAPSFDREDFLVTPANALAVRAVEDEAAWPGGKFALIGPPGSGKSHLARVWADAAGARFVTGAALGADAVPALCETGRVAVEDAEAVAGDAGREQALFHLHNHLLAAGGRLLLTAGTAPAHWPLVLPDLASRLAATATATIERPDAALLAGVLVKLFADRQLAVPPAVVRYLVPRMDRSLATARDLVAALDARALAERRPVTVALAAEVLDSTGAALR
jgi:chromosomal replication initiation ATPase DnaA